MDDRQHFWGAGRKKDCQLRILYPVKLPFKKQDQDIFKWMKADRIHVKQMSTTKNGEGGSSGWRRMIPDKNSELQEGKNIRNDE